MNPLLFYFINVGHIAPHSFSYYFIFYTYILILVTVIDNVYYLYIRKVKKGCDMLLHKTHTL